MSATCRSRVKMYLQAIRSISVDLQPMLNGVYIPFSTGVEMANIEQIEVLKGPESILFRRADPGESSTS